MNNGSDLKLAPQPEEVPEVQTNQKSAEEIQQEYDAKQKELEQKQKELQAAMEAFIKEKSDKLKKFCQDEKIMICGIVTFHDNKAIMLTPANYAHPETPYSMGGKLLAHANAMMGFGRANG